MYGLPEVHLFGAETLAEWWQQCKEATFNMDHGLVRVVAQLFFGDQTEENVQRGWLAPAARAFHDRAGDRRTRPKRVCREFLVDKSPSIVYRIETMQRVYAMFPQARFLHLVRHPRGHGESVMKYLRARRKLGPGPRRTTGCCISRHIRTRAETPTRRRTSIRSARGWRCSGTSANSSTPFPRARCCAFAARTWSARRSAACAKCWPGSACAQTMKRLRK